MFCFLTVIKLLSSDKKLLYWFLCGGLLIFILFKCHFDENSLLKLSFDLKGKESNLKPFYETKVPHIEK